MNVVPLVLYVLSALAYVWHFARRQPGSDARRPPSSSPAPWPTPSSSACRRWRSGHVPVTNASSAISSFVLLLALAYLYVEMTTEERTMGAFILPLMVAFQSIPAFNPGIEPRAEVLEGWLFGLHVVVAAVRVRELRARLRHRLDLRAALQGDQGEAPRRVLRAAAVAAGARFDEPARGLGRAGSSSRSGSSSASSGRHRRRATPEATRGCRPCRFRTPRFSSRS